MFPCANPVASSANASGGREVVLAGVLSASTALSAELTRTAFNGAIPGLDSTRIVIAASYVKINVAAAVHVTVTAG
jgi:hypothetical protein